MCLVNAEVDSMGGGSDGRLEISSTFCLQRSSDLEKTKAELRQTLTAAEKYRRELEFLQEGRNPLDLKYVSAASVGIQSTSLTDQHPEPFVTSESNKGSFAVTASPHGDSVGSSSRLGAPSVYEPNSADNLVLSEVKRRSTAALELPNKAYKRRVRSRPNRDGGRSSSSRDATGLVVASEKLTGLSSFNSIPKSSNASVTIKNLVSNGRLDTGLESLNSELSCTPNGQSLDVNNEDKLPASPMNGSCNGTMEQTLGFNYVLEEDCNLVKDECKIVTIGNNNLEACHGSHNVEGSVLKEDEGSKESEFALQNELKNPVSAEGVKADGPTDISEQSACSQNNLNLATKEHEDSILKEAQIVEAKRKRISETYVSTLTLQNHQNSHWDHVLEEMSWLANDFAQERLWKVTAAAQISRRVVFASQKRYQQQMSSLKQKEVAQTLGRDVIEFWHSIEVKCKDLELQSLKTDSKQGLEGYAMRFLEYNSIHAQCSIAQVPSASDVISDLSIIDIAWDDNMTEENLVYTVPPGAIETYRKSIESHLLQREGTWTGMQEEVDASSCDAVADNVSEEDGGTKACYLPGAFEGSKASKAIKNRKKSYKFYTDISYVAGADLPFMQSTEKIIGTRPSVLLCTKHVRTASRQRVLGPFSTGTSGYIQASNRTDASSGDTASFQDEQSNLHGVQILDNMEAESVGDYEKQLQFDLVEVSDGPRKKKKFKHLGYSFNHQWPLDSEFQNDLKDHSKRRLDAHHLDSIKSNGIQHNLKKLKIKQSSNNSFADVTPLPRSIPSPVTSQMSNMSNPKKFMELLVPDRRDHGRRSKSLKIPVGQPDSGSPWSLFEDQSLVVLVHDMGPNWELISDAINSNLQFKCVFRSSKECKERHKMLMDRSTDDGADSAQDSELSKPYSSTLPGIPEGSARQLFQRLQGPMEEDTLKSHFEKIIIIGRKQYYRRTKKDNQDPKQLQQPHSSYTLALSQVSPNNLSGVTVLTPMDFLDAIVSTPDVPTVGYQGSHSGGLPVSDQVNGVTMPPGSGSSSSVPGSSNLTHASDFSSAPVPLIPPVRDGRYGIPRMGPGPQKDQMLSGRNLQHSSLSPKPGFQGAASPSMAMPNTTNIQSRVGPGQGSSMLKPGEAMQLMRPNQNIDHQSQILPVSQPLDHQKQPHPHALATNSENRNNLQGHHNQALRMRLIKERQFHQQRVLQQHQLTQPPKSQLPVSSPQDSTQIQPQSSPKLPPSMVSIAQSSQKHPVLPPRGLVRSPQTDTNHQILKHQSQSPLFQQHIDNQMQAASSKKFLQQKPDNRNHQNHAPALVASSSTMPSNNQHPWPQTHHKLLHLSQRMVNNQLVKSSEPSISKLRADQSMTINNSQISQTVPIPQVPCSVGTSSETF